MLRRKLAALVTALGLLWAMSAPAGAAPETAPRVSIVSTAVTRSGTLEVSIHVDSGSFRSVAAVLRYDPGVLEVVDWTGDKPGPITVTARNSGWREGYQTVYARGCDRAAAKPALLRQNTEGTEGFLFFGAESFEPVALSGRAVTVRFRCVDDAGGEKLAELVKNEAGQIGAAGTVLSFAPAPEATEVARGRLQCTQEAGGLAVVYADGGFTADGTGLDGDYPHPLDVDWQAPKEGEGVVDSGEYGVCGVTFLDWDGTILETSVLPRGGDVTEQVDALIADPARGLKAALAEGAKPGYVFDCWLNCTAAAQADEPPAPANNQPLAQLYEGREELYRAVTVDMTHIQTSLGYGRSGITVQAAYYAAANVDDGGTWVGKTQPGGDYSLDQELVFDRYGAASETEGKYSIKVQLSRVQTNGANVFTNVGVERAREPGVIAAMYPKDGALAPIFTFQPVDNREIVQFELVPTKDIAYVEFALVDAYGVKNWPNAGARSGPYVRVDMDRVVAEGTANYIFRQAILELLDPEHSEWDLNVDETAFRDMLYQQGGVFDLAEAKAKMLADARAFLELNGVVIPDAAARISLLSAPEEDLAATLAQAPAGLGWGGGFTITVDGRTLTFPSYAELKRYLDELGGNLVCTITAYDPKKPIGIQLWRWDEEAGSYGAEPAYRWTTPVWTPELEGEHQSGAWTVGFRGNGLGTGVYEQRVVLEQLEAGRYMLVLDRANYLPITIQGLEIKLSSEAGNGNIPQELVKIYQEITGSRVTSFYLPCGDLDEDGFVRVDDSTQIVTPGVLGQPAPPEGALAKYDLDGDGYVTMEDHRILFSPENLGQSAMTISLSS